MMSLKKNFKLGLIIGISVLVFPSFAMAADKVNPGDTAWLLVSAALVMLMTPGLALFYGGMVRSKNVLNTIMQCLVMLFVVSIVWVLWGYSLSFSSDIKGLIGDLRWFGLRGIGQEPAPLAPTVPHYAFVMFQGMFAIITPALITGAFAERMKFSSLVIFSILWLTFVYAPLCHWVWGGGWIATKLHALDFAGGTVVHINSAVAALAAVAAVGKRRGFGKESMSPHNLTLTVLGAGLLWFGWFGFNAGSALSSGSLASLAFVTTNTAAAAAATTWMFVEWVHRRKPTALGSVSGAVAGLVAITPAAGFVGPLSAIAIGVGAGLLCYIAVNLKAIIGFDDTLDVVGIHGIGGMWGALATGFFASKLVNPAGANGVFFGNPKLFVSQLIAVGVTFGYVFVVSLFLFKIIQWSIGLRVSEEHEVIGLDLALHGERGYEFGVHGGTTAYATQKVVHVPVTAREEKPISSKRIPPKTMHQTSGSTYKGTLSEKTSSTSEKISTMTPMKGEFKIEVRGVETPALSKWWRSLCEMDWRSSPEAFKSIYAYLKRFENGVFLFKGGSPAELKIKLEELLASSGFSGVEVILH
jgi:Amt family ammonium transporter